MKTNAGTTLSAGVAIAFGLLASAPALASPVNYVRVCDQSGAGYFYVPGTDQCADARLLGDLQKGLAAAFAMTNAPMPSAPGKTTWSLNVSAIQSTNFSSGLGNKMGFGGSLGHRIDVFNKPFMFTLGYSTSPGGFHAGRIGVAGEF